MRGLVAAPHAAAAAVAVALLLPSTVGAGGPPHAGLFDLPPLLQFANGTDVRWPADWPARRAEMRDLLEQWYFGKAPTTVPPLVAAREVRSAQLVRSSRAAE